MLYENYETEISQNNLSKVFSEVPEPLCLLGGWAVYLTVNNDFEKVNNRKYHGSKDIDLGFHIDEKSTDNVLIESAFNKSITVLEKNGFYLIGSRLVQHYHIDTKKSLTPEESKKIPTYEMFDLYVDPIVDRVIPNIKSTLSINPVDEPLLREVFENRKYRMIDAFGVKLMLPNPEVLLATKLNSVLQRQKDHKRIKDIADIYALIWHSGIKILTLQKRLLQIINERTIFSVISQFTDQDYEAAGKALEVPKDNISRVIKSFIPIQVPTPMEVEESEQKDEKWRIPFNITYEGYTRILKALYQQKADTVAITLDRMTSITQMNRNTLSVNLVFLKSINVVSGDGKTGYRLTPLGLEYSKGHYSDDAGLIQAKSKEIILNSHLKSLVDFLEINKTISAEKIFGYIKSEGRFAEGPGYTGLSSPYASGARVLIRIFQDANVLPSGIVEEIKSLETTVRTAKSRTENKPKSSKSNSGRSKSGIHKTDLEEEAPSSSFGRLIVTGVTTVDITDRDSLQLAESALKILKKKVEAQQIGESTNTDTVEDTEENS